MLLKDKVAVITGAATGIGREIARAFARAGARVAVADCDDEGARSAVAELSKGGTAAFAVPMDVSTESSVDTGIRRVIEAFGRVDVLVSNAGNQIIGPIEQLSFTDWKRVLAVHLDGAFLTTRSVLPHMYRQRGGSIIYMGSIHSKQASRLKAPYVTAKHGLLGLARAVAKEGAAHGVRANVICPGFVRTALVERQIPEQARTLGISAQAVVSDVMLRDTVDGEFTTLQDVAEVALFFAAFATSALTGQSLNVSHGWSMQ